MPSFILTPNMNLPNPTPGVDPGPDYADNLQSSLILVDQHNHSPGHGALINPNGISINSDLTFAGNNATNLNSIQFTPRVSPLATINSLYESGVDLWYTDTGGNQIQITKAGSVNATSAGLSSGSNTASFVANQLVVDSAPNTPANIVGASLLLGNNVVNSNYLTLQPPSSMPTNYSLTLPSIPGSNSFLTVDTSGNIAGSVSETQGILFTMLAPSTVASLGANIIPPGSITMFGGASAPTGYLLCDGSSYLQSDFPNLFSAIGVAYGSADGTHFNVPDFRGVFPRGVTGASSNDPNASSRTAANTGGNTGNNVGSFQASDLLSHNHQIAQQTGRDGPNTSGNNLDGNAFMVDSLITGISGPATTSLVAGGGPGDETRPINLYVNFIVKT